MKISKKQLKRIIREALAPAPTLPEKLTLPYGKNVIRRDRANYVAIRNDLNPHSYLPNEHMFLRVTPVEIDLKRMESILRNVQPSRSSSLSAHEVIANYNIYEIYETTTG